MGCVVKRQAPAELTAGQDTATHYTAERPARSQSPVAASSSRFLPFITLRGSASLEQLMTLGIVWKKVGQCMCEVTMRRVRVTIVAMQTR